MKITLVIIEGKVTHWYLPYKKLTLPAHITYLPDENHQMYIFNTLDDCLSFALDKLKPELMSITLLDEILAFKSKTQVLSENKKIREIYFK